jgi:integrase
METADMARGINKLSVKFIERKDLKPGLYSDGRGLGLQVSPTDDPRRVTKAWVYRYTLAGRPRKMGLGDASIVKLADARNVAYAAYLKVKDGIDPIEERNARKNAVAVERVKAMTFEECAKGYIDAHRHEWKNAKHAGQWVTTLETYAFGVVGKLPVSAIEIAHVEKILKPIWKTKGETARRVRSRIEMVLDRASALKLRSGDNPARLTGELKEILGPQVKEVNHHEALPYKELPAFMKRLRKREGISARALEWTILTARRTGDVRGAVWSEIDLHEKLWVIPAARLKGKIGRRENDHVVPLSERAIAILNGLPREGDFVFPGNKAGKGLADMVLADFLREMDATATVHGFRSTFRDWAAEQTSYPHELAEMALAHVIDTKTERAYRRGDMREKRRRMMRDWSEFCATTTAAPATVVPIRGGR